MKLTTILLVTLISIPLVNCSTTQKLNVSVKPVDIAIHKQPNPRDLALEEPNFVVVNAKNLDKIKSTYLINDYILYAITPTDFKKIIKNQAELKRYIDQHKSIIVYYEKVTNAQ